MANSLVTAPFSVPTVASFYETFFQLNWLPMSGDKKNSLERAASAYLRSAMAQPVDWNEWGDAAFAKAQAEDKPMLLDIGAVWCHWCHVMDRESYENTDTARIINDQFVAITVDRGERPDVANRYQTAG